MFFSLFEASIYTGVWLLPSGIGWCSKGKSKDFLSFWSDLVSAEAEGFVEGSDCTLQDSGSRMLLLQVA